MSTITIRNPPSASDWARTAANAQHIEDYVNGSTPAVVTTPGGETRDNLARWDSIIRTRYGVLNSRGAWVTATAYAVNDLYTSGGNTYIVLTAHTSAASVATDLAAGRVGIYRGVTAADLADPATGADLVANADRSIATIAALRVYPKPALAAGRTLVVTVQEYAAGTGRGGGQFRWDAASTATDDGGLVINPSGNAGAGRWLRMFDGPVCMSFWGATGNGTTDDTAAVQAAIDYMTSLSSSQSLGRGVRLVGDVGATYRITGPVQMRAVVSHDWDLDLAGSQFLQVTDNTPCLQVSLAAGALCYNAKIKNIKGRWVNNQPPANTNAAVVNFTKSVAGGIPANFFNGLVEFINNINGCRAVSNTNVGGGFTGLWGCTIRHITKQNTASGACVWHDQDTAIAFDPRNHYDQIYANSNIGTPEIEPSFYAKGQSAPTIGVIETNGWRATSVQLQTCLDVTWEHFHIEGSQIASQAVLLDLCGVTINAIDYSSCTFANGSALVKSTTPSARSSTLIHTARDEGANVVTRLDTDGSVIPGGTAFVLDSNSGVQTRIAHFTPIEAANLKWWDETGVGTMNIAALGSQTAPVNGTDNGDANKTLVNLVDAETQFFSTTLTANRTVTLSQLNAYGGAEFTLVRDAATPGAFTLTVTGASGTIYTMPINQRVSVTFIWRRFSNWRVKSITVLP